MKTHILDFQQIGARRELKNARSRLHLQFFLTTTIGSLPQTAETRKKQSLFKKELMSCESYESFIKIKTSRSKK